MKAGRYPQTMKLTFDKGTIQIQGSIRIPNSTWDIRSQPTGRWLSANKASSPS